MYSILEEELPERLFVQKNFFSLDIKQTVIHFSY